MANKHDVVGETFMDCLINTTGHGYTITGRLTYSVVDPAAMDPRTNLQRAKQWILNQDEKNAAV